MRSRINGSTALSAAFLLLALLRWPHPIPETPQTRALVDPHRPAVAGIVQAPTVEVLDGIPAPIQSPPAGTPLIGPGLRIDLDALVGSWDQLRPGMPRPDSWQARLTASLVANLLQDAAYQDALWLGREPDPQQTREQIKAYFSERRSETTPRVAPTEFPPDSPTPHPK